MHTDMVFSELLTNQIRYLNHKLSMKQQYTDTSPDPFLPGTLTMMGEGLATRDY